MTRPGQSICCRCFLFLGLLRNEQGFPVHSRWVVKAQSALNWEALGRAGGLGSLGLGLSSVFVHMARAD